ncbi:MAG TPA: prepilin-type N-terminal cleavage/methylation domain-containing protein [Thermoanaerobaculia bacterium]|jgi:prepilin-type N-terminal cleavage/methylation domain-containing protein
MLTRIHNRQKGFTLIELLIVIAIIGIIAALLIPNFLDALQKAKQKRSMADMRNTGTALFAWFTDQQGAAAAGQAAAPPEEVDLSKIDASDADAIKALLVPQYTNRVAGTDAWKNDMHYFLTNDATLTNNVMAIASGGADGDCDCAVYKTGAFEPTDYDEDLVWADGFFVRWPQKIDAAAAAP